jgi:GTP-binding protein EngB required for normal cell division
VVATKADRLSNNELSNALKRLAEAYPGAPVIGFSSKSGSGRDELWKRIRAAVDSFSATASLS